LEGGDPAEILLAYLNRTVYPQFFTVSRNSFTGEYFMAALWHALRQLVGRSFASPGIRRSRSAGSLTLERLEERCLLRFTVTDLGTMFRLRVSHGWAINDFGQVAGDFAPSPDLVVHAGLFSDGTLTNLGTLGGAKSNGYGINASGQVVGSAETADGSTHGFLYRDGAMTDLGTLGGATSAAQAINAAGVVAGSAATPSGFSHAFLDYDGTMTDLGTLGGPTSLATALNDAGQVAGSSVTSEAVIHAFGPNGGPLKDLGTLGGPNSNAYAINNAGDVVGSSDTPDGETHAFLFHDGVMSDLGTIPGYTRSYAYSINDAGAIVGDVHAAGNLGRPFLYSRGVMTNLNNLIPPDSGLTLLSARAINDAGQIVGWGRYIGSTPDHAVLLTPGPDETTAVDVGLVPRADVLVSLPIPGSSPHGSPDQPTSQPLFLQAPPSRPDTVTPSPRMVPAAAPLPEWDGLALAISDSWLLF
jgi:probable HAF family extracellular repeat protein